MSVPLENWGQLRLSQGVKSEGGESNSACTFDLCSLPKGKERNDPHFVSQPIISVPIDSIVSASGTTKNDISLTLQSRSSVTMVSGTEMELTSVRFAVPNTCIGYERTEEAGKEILKALQDAIKARQSEVLGSGNAESGILRLATMATGASHKNEQILCVFDDVVLSCPSGKYKLIVSNYQLVLENKKSGSAGIVSLPLSDVSRIFLCDVPSHFSKTRDNGDTGKQAQYVVLILKSPLKIRTTTYAHVVIYCSPDLVLDEEHPWKCELSSQEKINEVLQYKSKEGEEPPLTPSMSGPVSEILVRSFKALAKVGAYSGYNKAYTTVLTQHTQSCMSALYRSTEGILYILKDCLLFLHRPPLKLAYSDISMIEVDESECGVATFQINVMMRGTKHVLSGLDKAEKDGLLKYLASVTKLNHFGVEDDDDNVEDDSDESEDAEEEESDGDLDSDEDEDEDEDEDGKKHHKKKQHKRHHSSKDHHKKKHRKKE